MKFLIEGEFNWRSICSGNNAWRFSLSFLKPPLHEKTRTKKQKEEEAYIESLKLDGGPYLY